MNDKVKAPPLPTEDPLPSYREGNFCPEHEEPKTGLQMGELAFTGPCEEEVVSNDVF